uniref:Uncharacterized protein n=1 Tax=Amblyomma cajennense TaxID=34607 RepID=A0A023FBB4_AMBCJ
MCVAYMSYVWVSSIVSGIIAFAPKLLHASHLCTANGFTFSLGLEPLSVESGMFLPGAAAGYVINLPLMLFFLEVPVCKK